MWQVCFTGQSCRLPSPCTPCYPQSLYPSLSWQLQPDQVEKDVKSHHTKHQPFLPTPQQHSLPLLLLPFYSREGTTYFHLLRKLLSSSKEPSSGPHPLFHCFSSFLDCLSVILLRQACRVCWICSSVPCMGHPFPHRPSAHMFASALHLFPHLQAHTSVCLTLSWSNFCHKDHSQLCQLIFPRRTPRLKQMNSETSFPQKQEQALSAVARELQPLTLSPTLRPS